MKLFESDNIWKKRKRRQMRDARPHTPETALQDAREALISDLLWFFGAALILVLAILGLRTGAVAADSITLCIVVVLALYLLVNLGTVSRRYKTYRELKNNFHS